MKVNIRDTPVTRRERVSVDITSNDIYTMDTTLSYVILPMLMHLREVKQGIPMEFTKVGGDHFDDQQCFDFYSDTYDEAFNLRCEDWYEILDKMIWSFSQHLSDEWTGKYRHGKASYDHVPVSHDTYGTVYTIVDKDPNSHWFDDVGERIHTARIQEGFELFGKHFRNLFD